MSSDDDRPRVAAVVFLTGFALVAFAGNSLLCRLALRDGAIDAWSFTALRLGCGALALLPLARRAPAGGGAARSGAALLAYALCFSVAYVTLDAGTGALILFGTVQVTMIGAGLRAGERPGPLRILGLLAAVAGVVWLVAPGVDAPDPLGAALMAAAGLAWGVYSLLGRGVSSPARATARNFLVAAPLGLVGLLAAGALGGGLEVTPRGALLAAVSGAVTSGLGYVVWYAALRGHSATSASVVQLSVPVLAALGGVALLGEALTPRLVAASAVTLGGVALAVLAPRSARAGRGRS